MEMTTTAPAATQSIPQETVFDIAGMSVHYGKTLALSGVSLEIYSNSITALIGPSGCGKSTFLRCLNRMNDLVPNVAVGGRIHYHGVDLYDRLTGEQLITFSGMLFGLERDVLRERVADLLSLLDLQQAAGTIVADYSAGMTKKIALAAALVHSPRLLVLDEPFESVDPVSAANIRDILHGFVRGGGTVVVSSHSMDLVQRMCDHVAIVAAGRVLVAGTVDEVRGDGDLESRFLELVGGRRHEESPAWLLSS